MKRYFKHVIENLLVIQKIVTLHYFTLPRDFCSHGEAHNFWEIVYADKHDIFYTVDGKRSLLREGEMLFHKPNEFHVHSADGKNEPTVFIISFETRSDTMRFFENKKIPLRGELRGMVYSMLDVGRRTFDMSTSNADTKKMELLEKPALGGMQSIRDYLELMLIGIMRTLTENKQGENRLFLTKADFRGRIVDDIIKYMKENLDRNLTVNDICERVNYSRSYIFPEFRAATGKTLKQYYTRLKLDEARRLLRDTVLSASEIASILGYESANAFTKAFARHEGITISEYRRKEKLI